MYYLREQIVDFKCSLQWCKCSLKYFHVRVISLEVYQFRLSHHINLVWIGWKKFGLAREKKKQTSIWFQKNWISCSKTRTNSEMARWKACIQNWGFHKQTYQITQYSIYCIGKFQRPWSDSADEQIELWCYCVQRCFIFFFFSWHGPILPNQTRRRQTEFMDINIAEREKDSPNIQTDVLGGAGLR